MQSERLDWQQLNSFSVVVESEYDARHADPTST